MGYVIHAQPWSTEPSQSISSLRRTSKLVKISISPSPLASPAPQSFERQTCLSAVAAEIDRSSEISNLFPEYIYLFLEYIYLFSQYFVEIFLLCSPDLRIWGTSKFINKVWEKGFKVVWIMLLFNCFSSIFSKVPSVTWNHM